MIGNKFGAFGEEVARAEYKRRGFAIIGSNVIGGVGKQVGEIDFIALSKTHIVFVEVKTRTVQDGKFGSALESVGPAKQRRILKMVQLFLLKHAIYRELIPQIDVCVVDGNGKSVIIYPNAIEDIY